VSASRASSRGNRCAQSSAASAKKPGLAEPPRQVPDQRHGQELGVGADWHRPRRGCNGHGPRADCVIDQHVRVDEQILGMLAVIARCDAQRSSRSVMSGGSLSIICAHMLAI
jgi:hypothetical protein